MSTQDDNLVDKIIFYCGVVLAVLGMALAGVAVLQGMLLK